MTHIQLSFDCIDRFIATGATPIENSTIPLPKIKPPTFLDEQIRPSDFSALCTTYVGSNADYMLSSFFAAHLLMKFASIQSKYCAVEILEDLFVNCSIKDLKGVDDLDIYKNGKYGMLKKFQREFSMSMQERDAFGESQTISDRSQIIYQDSKNIIQDLKNTLCETKSISDKSKDVFQNIRNMLSDIKGEDKTSTSEPISSRLRSKGRIFAPSEIQPIPSLEIPAKGTWNLDDPKNLEETSDLEDSF